MITLEPPRAVATEAEGWRLLGLSRVTLSRYLHAAQKAVGLKGEVAVLLTGDKTIRRLNREFRGKDKATDVLSFPAPAEFASEHAGDLAISLETAAQQACALGHSLADEVRVLLLHGLLHLSGMDHENDNGQMASRELMLRKKLGLESSLIERVAAGAAAKPAKRKRKVANLKKVAA